VEEDWIEVYLGLQT